MMQPKKILALGAHPDDIEFSSGATMKRFAEEGVEIYWAVFSPCVKSLPPGSDPQRLYKEMRKSAEILGIPKEHLYTYNFEVRYFTKTRQDILEEMIVLKKKLKPDLVFLPNSVDIHQDHQVIHNEGVRAFKNTCVLGYELPWNDIEFKNNYFIKVNKEHILAKVEAIDQYESQNARVYKSADFYFSLAMVRGTQMSVTFAESFELIRWIQ